jgi:hypothetical protein
MAESWLSKDEEVILQDLGQIGAMLKLILTEQRQSLHDIDTDIDNVATAVAAMTDTLAAILAVLTPSTPSPAVGLTSTVKAL